MIFEVFTSGNGKCLKARSSIGDIKQVVEDSGVAGAVDQRLYDGAKQKVEQDHDDGKADVEIGDEAKDEAQKYGDVGKENGVEGE